MDRRQFLVSTSLLATGSFLPGRKLLAREHLLEFTPLRRNVGFFSERGGTIGWLASADALVVVDSQFPESAQNCLHGLQQKTSHPIDLLINTHHHGDHTSGNTVFKPLAQEMVAHKNVPGLMQQSADNGNPPAYPTTTYERTWKMDVGDETVHARHFGPAHTGGDTVVYFEKANVAHMGDLVFNRMNPYTDRPSGASIHNWITVLQTVTDELPTDTIYIFGHGKPEYGVTGNKEDVGVMRSFLSAMVQHVREGVARGQTKEEITSIKSLNGFEEFQYADWWTLSQNLGVIYEEIMEK
jgi:glyoxylase-like metal-dependent hydrolase (beta-lactamase superfamily II)